MITTSCARASDSCSTGSLTYRWWPKPRMASRRWSRRWALKAGASGYVLKGEADQDLVAAIRSVGRGDAFLTNLAERSIIRGWMEDGYSGPGPALTPREEEVVKLIAEAHTNAQIAELLHLSEKTVESHRANVLRKLGMRDRVQLVRYAIRRGLVEP